MLKISAIILAKNSEETIADTIDSVSFCDEVIVVDDSSIDRTVDICKHMGAKIFNFNDISFSKKRNFGFQKSKGKWVFYIDSDEVVDKDLKLSIKHKILDTKQNIYSVFRVKRKNFYFGKHEWPSQEKFERLFDRVRFKGFEGLLHETPVASGNIGELDGFINHYTHRDLSSMVEKTNKWSKLEAQLRHGAKHPKMYWWRFPRVMLGEFFKYYFIQKGYKAGTAGFIESLYQSFSIFITYVKLWEMQEKKA